MNITIITACPSGTATSILAAGVLEKAAKKLGWNTAIECQSSVTDAAVLTAEQINQCDAVIIASNTPIDDSRFVGKKVYRTSISECLTSPESFLQSAVTQAEVLTEASLIEPKHDNTKKRIVAITACPTGVAHTFMAAEALEDEAIRQGYEIKVETRGSVGAKNQLTAEEIEKADLVIIAADIEVPLDRFNGKLMYRTKTGPALKKTKQEIERAFDEAHTYQHSGNTSTPAKEEKKGVYSHLMTGVSHMLPVVVAGGLIIALSFVFGIKAFEEKGTLAAALMTIGGGSAFKLMIPVLAGISPILLRTDQVLLPV